MPARKPRRTPAAKPAAAPRRSWAGALVLLAALALALRAIYLFELRDTAFFSILIGDSLQFDMLARRILSGDWTGSDVFYQAQLYPYLLALAYSVFGHDPFIVRVLQSILGAASCVLLAVAGRRFFDARTGLIAGGLLAIYPPAIFFDGLIHKSSPDLFIITVLLVAIAACTDSPRPRWLLLAGVALGALAWNRENARVLYPLIAVWLLLLNSRVPLRTRATWVAIFTAGMAAVLVPVALRNARISGEFFVTTSQFGPNFYIGNHRGASGGYEPLVPGRGNALFEREDAIRIAEAGRGRTLTPGEVSDYWWERTVADIREAPGVWLGLLARKAWLTFAAGEPIDTESIEAYAASSRLLRALAWFDFGILMGLALFGVWMTRARWRMLLVLYGTFVVMAISVVMFFVFARYRFPLAPLAMLFAAAALASLLEVRTMPSRSWLAAAGLSVGVAVLLHLPVRTSTDETYANYGSELLRLGRPGEAVPLLRDAVRTDPSHVPVRLSLALALQQTQQREAALEELNTAVRVDPQSAEAHAGLAIALHQQGKPQDAIVHYREAIRLKPDSVEAMSNLALALQEIGDSAAAISQFQRAIELQPRSVPLRMNLGQLLLDTGRPGDAIATFRQAAAVAGQPQDVVRTEYAVATALARAGRVAEAIPSLERALAAARSVGDTEAITTIDGVLRALGPRRQP
jgi:Flp pilus assembly protein TadD